MSDKDAETADDGTLPLAEGGNAESVDIFAEAGKAMADADAVKDAEVAAKVGALTGETPPKPPDEAPKPEGAKPDAEAKPEEKKPEEVESPENVANGFYALRRKRTALNEREAALNQRDQELTEATPVIEAYRALRNGDHRAGLEALARIMGKDPNALVLDIIGDLAESDKAKKPAEQVNARQLEESILSRIRAEQAEVQQEQRANYWQGYFAETMSMAKAKDYPALAAMSDGRLQSELVSSIEWAIGNRPELLNNKVEFVKTLNALAQDELDSTYQAYQAMRGNGTPSPAAKPEATLATPPAKQADAPERTTLDDEDTSHGGATRVLSVAEQLEKVARLFE
jgi:hypothetical protein